MKFLSNILFIDKIWGDKVSANRWLLPLSILTAALTGAVFGGLITFGSASGTTLVVLGGSLIALWGYNLAESIIASETPLVAFGRSVLTLIMIIGVFALSCVATIVVLIVIGLMLVLFVFSFMSSNGLKNSKKRSDEEYDAEITDEYGGTVKLKDYGTMLQGDDGHKYRRTTGGVERIE